MDEREALRDVIFTLIEKGIFKDIDLGLPFYIFIMDDKGNEYIPIQYKECKGADDKVEHKGCASFWKNQMELGRMMDDVIYAQCPIGFGTLLIPLRINDQYVGIIGGCIPKKNIPKRAIEKSLALFRGISRVIELLGNNGFYYTNMIEHLTAFIQEVHSGYSIDDPNSIFYSPINTVQNILKEFQKILGEVELYLFLKGDEKNSYLYINDKESKTLSGSEGIDYFINNIKYGEQLGPENPLFGIGGKPGLLFPVASGSSKSGYLFIEHLPKVSENEDVKKYIELMLLLFSSIHANSVIFSQINKRGRTLYEQEVVNFFKLEKLVYQHYYLISDDIQSNVSEMLGEEFSVYVKDNIDERDGVFRLYLSKGISDPEYLTKPQLEEKKYSEHRELLYFRSSSKLKQDQSALLYDLVFSDITFHGIRNIYHSYIYTIINGFEFKDPFKVGKSQRILEMCELLGSRLKLKADDLEMIRFAVYFMDVGMIGVPEEIFEKKTKLTAAEKKKIQRHSLLSKSLLEDFPHFHQIVSIIEDHHEKWDGSGHPTGKKGEDISNLSQIIQLAETYVSLLHHRKHRSALTREDVLRIIDEEKGKAFDPKIVAAFEEVLQSDL
ncbi:HD domain-containing protein [bacterium]|nr:HD domain-containing protein [bacterium]